MSDACPHCNGIGGTSGVIPYAVARWKTPCTFCNGTGRTIDLAADLLASLEPLSQLHKEPRMAIKDTSITDLPRAGQHAGLAPSENPRYVSKIAQQWEAEYDTEEGYGRGLAIPDAGPYRGSMAGTRCDRALHYAMTGIECDECGGSGHDSEGTLPCAKCQAIGLAPGVIPLPASNPPTLADKYRFKVGKMVHSLIEELVPEVFPDDESEVTVDLRSIGIPGSAHADQVHYERCTCYVTDGSKVRPDPACPFCDGSGDVAVDVIEYKTINGFGFKMATTTFKGPPEGPRSGATLQAALVAAALNAENVVVGNWSLENLSPGMASSFSDTDLSRFTAEWEYPMESLRDVVDFEVKRVNRVLKFQGTDILPARQIHDAPKIPAGAVFTDPSRGTYEVRDANGQISAAGKHWSCDYCPQRDRCIADGAS